ncbi:MAG: hypothetical protein CMJ18_06915 [Phycisphaeraceae bacterium]|nr:hypothetical protein [Phycisphaeraceae bacterium]
MLISFDTEDFLTPQAHDAAGFYARTLSSLGMRGTFFVVARKALALRESGRSDVIAQLAEHEIGYHGYDHSVPPTMVERCEGRGFEGGVEALLDRERRGIEAVSEVFDASPVSFCPPGANWSVPIYETMRRLGLRIMSDCAIEREPGPPAWFSGVLVLGYHFYLDGYFDQPDLADRLRADFDTLATEAAGRGGYLTMFSHPTMVTCSAFWDGVNFQHGRNPLESQWEPAPLRTPEQTARIQRELADFLSGLAAREDLEFLTYRDVVRRHCRTVTLMPADVEVLARKLLQRFTYHDIGDQSVSPAEAFVAVTACLGGQAGDAPLEIEPTLGPIEPSPDETSAAPTTVEALQSACRALRGEGPVTIVPATVNVGNHRLGAADFLRTCCRALAEEIHHQDAETPVDIVTGPALPVVAETARFRALAYQGVWGIFPPTFTGAGQLELARLQSWSYRAEPKTS